MSKRITFQKTYTRNSHEWETIHTPTGRIGFLAKGGGVKKRIGYVMLYLKVNPNTSGREMLDHLQRECDSSYSSADVRHALTQMVKAGMVRESGDKWNKTYRLSGSALRIFKRL